MVLTVASAFLWYPADPAGVQGMRSGESTNKKHPSAPPQQSQNMAFPLAQTEQ